MARTSSTRVTLRVTLQVMASVLSPFATVAARGYSSRVHPDLRIVETTWKLRRGTDAWAQSHARPMQAATS